MRLIERGLIVALAIWALLPATDRLQADSAPCDAFSAGAETDTATRSFLNAGQAVIGLTSGAGGSVHAGLIPCFVINGDANPPSLASAVSRKNHTGAGNFDIALPLSPPGSAGVECRAGGPTQVIITFNEPIKANDGTLNAGDEVLTGSGVIGSLLIAGNALTINLSGVPDQSCLILTVEGGANGITDLAGNPLLGDRDVHVRCLQGDVNGDGLVASADITQVKARSGQNTVAGNFRFDVNADGIIASADITQVKARSGNSTVCPPIP